MLLLMLKSSLSINSAIVPIPLWVDIPIPVLLGSLVSPVKHTACLSYVPITLS